MSSAYGSRGSNFLSLSPDLLGRIFDQLAFLDLYQTVPRVCHAFRRALAHTGMAGMLDLTGWMCYARESGPDRTLQVYSTVSR